MRRVSVAEGCRRPEEMTAQECDVWEGAEKVYFDALNQPLQQFCDLWDSINGKTYPWASNPWCWVLSFRNVAQEGGAL